jgi:hypothetical protein
MRIDRARPIRRTLPAGWTPNQREGDRPLRGPFVTNVVRRLDTETA